MKKALYRVQGNNIQLKNLMARGVGFMVHGKRLIKKMANHLSLFQTQELTVSQLKWHNKLKKIIIPLLW